MHIRRSEKHFGLQYCQRIEEALELQTSFKHGVICAASHTRSVLLEGTLTTLSGKEADSQRRVPLLVKCDS